MILNSIALELDSYSPLTDRYFIALVAAPLQVIRVFLYSNMPRIDNKIVEFMELLPRKDYFACFRVLIGEQTEQNSKLTYYCDQLQRCAEQGDSKI